MFGFQSSNTLGQFYAKAAISRTLRSDGVFQRNTISLHDRMKSILMSSRKNATTYRQNKQRAKLNPGCRTKDSDGARDQLALIGLYISK